MLFTTKGDANNSADGTEIRQSDIHGKALFSIPFLGYIINFVKKPIGLMVVIVIPIVIIVYDEIQKIIKEITKMREKKNLVKKDENNNI
jgi:signal peptidase